MNTHDSPEHLEILLRQGHACRQNLLTLLEEWPIGENCWRIQFAIRTPDDQQLIREALKETVDWVKAVADYRPLHDRRVVNDIVRRLTFATLEEDFRANSVEDARTAIEEILSLLGRVPSPPTPIDFNKKKEALTKRRASEDARRSAGVWVAK